MSEYFKVVWKRFGKWLRLWRLKKMKNPTFQGALVEIQQLAKAMAIKKVKPTLKTYAAVLESLGRVKSSDIKMVKAVIAHAKKEVRNILNVACLEIPFHIWRTIRVKSRRILCDESL